MTKQTLVNEIKEIHVAIKSVRGDLRSIAAYQRDREKLSQFLDLGCASVSNICNWSSKANTTTKARLEEIKTEGLAFLATIKELFDKELAAM